jgi:hypothetical protein
MRYAPKGKWLLLHEGKFDWVKRKFYVLSTRGNNFEEA